MSFEILAGTMNGAVGLPAKDDVLTENLLKKSVKICCKRWLKFQIGIYLLLVKLQNVIILVKFQKNKNRKKEYLSFA